MASEEEHEVYKVLLVGDIGVGKTSIILRFADGVFGEKAGPTILDFKSKIIEVAGKKVKMQIWDTAGQERFGNITSSFYRSAQGVVIVYDVTKPDSFESVYSLWIPEIERFTFGNVAILIVGNKTDLPAEVTKAEAEKMTKIDILETSAKNDVNIDLVFNKLAEIIIKNSQQDEAPSKSKGTVDLKKKSHDHHDKKCNC